jgi:nicotinamidase-related amidase
MALNLNKKQETALLIIDIQNDYFEGGSNTLSGSWEASIEAKKLLDAFRSENLPVIHIQHLSVRPDATFFVPGTLGAEIYPHVKPLNSEKLFIKHFPNSFRDTGLHEYLKEKQITHLVICGMMTHMCIDATTRAAKDFGYTCTLVANACASKDMEINGVKVQAACMHNAFIAALSYFYAEVKNLNDLIL